MYWFVNYKLDTDKYKPLQIFGIFYPFSFKWLFASIILRPFLFVVTLLVLEAARAAVPSTSRDCSINAYKTLQLLRYIIVFSASKAQKPGEAG